MPEVSVIIPTRNRPGLLPQAIASAQAQTGVGELEIIVVDDGSDMPAHVELLAHLEDDTANLRVIRHAQCRGAAAARNTGIRQAKSPFVAFLDDDDTWEPSKLQQQVHLMHTLGDECVLVGCGVERIALGRSARIFAWPHDDGTPWIDFPRFVTGFCAFLQSILIRRSALDGMELMREDLQVLEDFEWVLRLLKTHRGATLKDVLVMSPEQPAGLFQRYDLRAYALSEIIASHRDLLNTGPGTLAFVYYELAKAHARNNHRLPALTALYNSWRLRPTAFRPYLALIPILLGASTVERLQRLGLGRR